MRIFAIEIYPDGGSIEFRVVRDGKLKHVWLNKPFQDKPRALLIDTVAVPRGAAEAGQLLADIEEWWKSQPSVLQGKALEALAHKEVDSNPDAETMKAIDASRVLYVRDYITKNYVA